MTVAIEIAGLRKQYTHFDLAVDGLSIPAGQVLGVLGPNGAGKTTLLCILAGLLTPDGGTVQLGGYDLLDNPTPARQQVAALLQGAGPLDGRRPVREYLPLSPSAEHQDLWCDFGLEELGDSPVADLSAGMQSRLALFVALSAAAPILLLDEPLWSLDTASVLAVVHCIRHLAAQDKTVLIATGQPQWVLEYCDRGLLLDHGRVVADVLLDRSLGLCQSAAYRIRVKGRLGPRWSHWFDELTVLPFDDETWIWGHLADQSALHGLLNRIRDLGLPLVAVNRVEPALDLFPRSPDCS